MSSLPATADVVVVGGGVIGTSVAFHLAEAGVDVCLIERDQLASGSTSRAAGGFRAQFSDPLNIAIGLRSIEAFTRFGERPGAEIDLAPGRLPVPSRPRGGRRRLRVQRRAAERARSTRVGSSISPRCRSCVRSPGSTGFSPPRTARSTATRARRPWCRDMPRARERTAHRFSPAARPRTCSSTTTWFAASRRPGARSRPGAVVCAAGVWSPEVARAAGVELPVVAVPARGRVHRPGARASRALSAHGRLLVRALLPSRRTRAPVRNGRPRAACRSRRARRSGLARESAGGGRATTARRCSTWASREAGRATTR